MDDEPSRLGLCRKGGLVGGIPYKAIRIQADRRDPQLMLIIGLEEMGSLMGENIRSGQSAGMRTLLRNVPTGLYVQSAETWTGNPDEAFDFKTLSQAIRFVEKAGLRKMELAFESPDLSHLTEVPLEVLSWSASVAQRGDQAGRDTAGKITEAV